MGLGRWALGGAATAAVILSATMVIVSWREGPVELMHEGPLTRMQDVSKAPPIPYCKISPILRLQAPIMREM